MGPRVRKAVARAYRLTTRPPGLEEMVEVQPGLTVPRFVLEWSKHGPEEARAFLGCVPGFVELDGKSVLALGRGGADLGIEVARRRARRVVAVDMAARRMKLTEARIEEEEEARLPVEIRPFAGSLAELGDERFDVVLAADAFRRYGAERSSRHLEELVGEMSAHLEEGGLLAVGFSPPWKSPFGGSGDSRVPWAHLVFPESVIFEEFRRVRSGNRAQTFDDIGINRITVARFRRAMNESSLKCLCFETNVRQSRAAPAMRALSRLKPLEEYFTLNAYGVWRQPRSDAA
ncbi:MAG: methyltransferase domain-containing protein [bacterium]